MAYLSEALDVGEIRTLQLHPGTDNDELSGSLQVVHLPPGSAQSYDALSYTWGASDENHLIQIEQASIPITDNLWYALRRLRPPNRTRNLWIDALCINQQDDNERSQQVSSMFETYSCADTVLVWLGEPDRSCSSIPHSQPRQLAIGQKESSPGVYDDLDHAIMTTQPPWWERAWTFQEIMASKQHVMCFGKWQVPQPKQNFDDDIFSTERKSFAELADWLFDYHKGQRHPRDLAQQRDKLYIQMSMFEEMQRGNVSDMFSFSALADVILRRSVLNPRDKIYCLLGLMDPASAKFITPNYSWSSSKVFAQATYAAIAGESSFDILTFVDRHSSRPAELPSWAVDFTARDTNTKFLSRRPLSAYLDNRRGQRTPTLHTSDGYRKLLIEGRLLGIVQSTTDIVSDWSLSRAPPSKKMNDYLNSFMDKASHSQWLGRVRRSAWSEQSDHLQVKNDMAVPRSLPIHRPIKSSFTKSPLRDEVASTPNHHASVPQTIDGAMTRAFNTWTVSAGFADGSSDLPLPFLDMLTYAKDTAGGAVLLTTDSSFIGAAPSTVDHGDVVVLFPGSLFPLVLRPSGEDFMLLGFCYIHGMEVRCNPDAEEVMEFWFETDLLTDRVFSLI